MNPLVKFSLENFNELVSELGRINKPEYLFELEDKVIDEIIHISSGKSKRKAKSEIILIKERLMKNVEAASHVKPILRSFQNSIDGATEAALMFL